MQLTDEAQEKFGRWMRFRLKLASFTVKLGFRIMPRPYWESVQKEEIKQMAKRYDLKVIDGAD